MKRRRFNQLLAIAAGRAALILSPLGFWIRPARAKTGKRVLDADTDLTTLLFEDPADLDPRNLPLTPIEKFGTMGVTDYAVDLSAWRLKIGGAVKTPLRLAFPKIKAMPVLERKALLICPGVFSFYAKWKGVSLWRILEAAGIDNRATHVTVTGAGRHFPKKERFSVAEVRADAAFLAYGVNDQPLPQKHGYPIRMVAENHVGDDWVKYVEAVTVEIGEASPAPEKDRSDGPSFLP